ncbi:MAG: glycosyltransferase family 4 protein [Flavipsychrobacter sp.]
MSRKKIIIVGLFPDVQQAPITQASELADLLRAHGYDVLTVSRHRDKWQRLTDIITTLFRRRSQYHVAIVQFYSGNSFIWQFIAAHIVKLLGKKLILTIHGGGVPAAIVKYRKRYLSVLNKADVITVPSGFIADSLGAYSLQTQIVENTIPLREYPSYNKEDIRPNILWMRSFGSIYNPLMAVRVIDVLKSYYPNVKMYMGGIDMGLLEETRQLIHELGLQHNIEIAGFMDAEKKKYYAEVCDVYMSTNRIDNAPVTFLEMWAMGLPIVSTNVGGVSHLVTDNEDGLLVADDDHKAMAEKIRLIIEYKTISSGLIEAGKEKVAAYDEEVVYHKWDNILSAL